MLTLPIIVDQWYALPAVAATHRIHSPLAAEVAFCIVILTICLGFCAAFWWNTRPSTSCIVLLIIQLALSFFFAETMFLVAVQLPFMMPLRQARRWLVVQCAVLIAAALTSVWLKDFVPVDSLTHVPLAISVPGTILYMLALAWFAFGAGYLAVSETRSHRELDRVNAELMATQSLLSDETRLAERLTISRELHDVVGHHLAGLSINLQLASHLVEGPASEPVNEAHLVAKLLLAEVREVVGGLRDPRQTDLRHAFELLASGIVAPRIHLALPEDLDRLDPVCAHIFFRCLQEAITNAIKHSRARNLWAELQQSSAGWELLVRDDGCGTDRIGADRISRGNGLKGMAERLQEVGGQLRLESHLGEGFTLRAYIPISGDLP